MRSTTRMIVALVSWILSTGPCLGAQPAAAVSGRMSSRLDAGLLLSASQSPTARQPKQSRPASTRAADDAAFSRLKAKAEAARDTDQIGEAIRFYDQLVKMRPQWAEGWWHLGALNYEKDLFQRGASAFGKFVLLEPKNGQGWAMLGLCEFKLKRNAAALQHLTQGRTLGLGGNDELARVTRYHQAVLLNLGKQFEAARAILAGFVVEERGSPEVLDALGMSALRISDTYESLSPDQAEMVRAFGTAAYLEIGRKQPESIELYGKLAVQYAGRPNVAYAYASALAGQTESEKAIAYFKKELERDPNHVHAMLQLALELTSLARLEEALSFAQTAAALEPENPVAFYTQGRIFLASDEIEKGIRMLETAKKLAPRFSQTRYLLAQAYQRAGRKADADRERAEFQHLREIERQRQGLIGTFSPEDQSEAPNEVKQP